MRHSEVLLAALLWPLGACDDSTDPSPYGSTTEHFEWVGQVAPGATVEIKNINGEVRAHPGSGSTVRVRAAKQGWDDLPSTVRIVVVETPQRVTFCAVYPDVPGLPPNQCLPGGEAQLASRGNDVSVRFEVDVPPGRTFVGATLAGPVEATGLVGYVVARTISGDIEISTTDLAEASTISGDIRASIGRGDWDRDLSFRAVEGHVTIWLPSATNADVWASTGRGTIATDFPLSITQVGQSRQLQGRLGSGGHDLQIATGSGNIAVRASASQPAPRRQP